VGNISACKGTINLERLFHGVRKLKCRRLGWLLHPYFAYQMFWNCHLVQQLEWVVDNKRNTCTDWL